MGYSTSEHVQLLYEIAMSIGARLNMKEMLHKSLSTFLKKLNCAAGEIYFVSQLPADSVMIEKKHSLPLHTDRNKACQVVHQQLAQLDTVEKWESFRQDMTIEGIEDKQYFYILELPNFGFMVLVKNENPLDPFLLKSLKPLLAKLASTCITGLQGEEFERSRKTLQTVLNTVGEGIITINRASQIVMVNQEVQNIWGYQESDLIGHSLATLMPEEYRHAHHAGMNRYLETGVASVLGKRLELEGLRKSGERFPLEVRITEAKIAEEVLFTAAVRDITERHELERMRDNFVSTVSHELRTPLASIMGFLETVLGGRPGPLTSIQSRFLNNSYKNSQRLLKLIEELLTISHIQQGQLRLEKTLFFPNDAVDNIQEMMHSLSTNKSIQLKINNTWDSPHKLLADQDRLEQVMINVINNAIKFTPASGEIFIQSQFEKDQWFFSVKDTGIGIPENDIPKLFTRFYRATNATEQQIQGTGLGLYVCKAIVDQHKGEIGIESHLDQGAVVWFRIPLTEDE